MQLTGLLIIFGCLLAGEAVILVTKLPLPPSVIGLLLLFGLLSSKKVDLERVHSVAKSMLDYLAFMIVPACISVVQYLDLIKKDALALVLATILSTVIALLVTAKTHHATRKALAKFQKTRQNRG